MTTDPWKHIHTNDDDYQFIETTFAMNVPGGCVLRVVMSNYKLNAMTDNLVHLPGVAVVRTDDGATHELVSLDGDDA
jgi:hypothetical protein